MFTGLIEEVGSLAGTEERGDGRLLRLRAPGIAPQLRAGESVAVNGVCLTVTSHDAEGFACEAVAATLGLTTLAALTPGVRVNLERAVALGERMGGHLVQGHVDGTGEVTRLERGGEKLLIDVSLPVAVAAVTVPQGSLAMDGISLTVFALPSPGQARVSIVPHTLEHTNLEDRREGDRVNLEGDLIGKYVARHLAAGAQPPAPESLLTLDLLHRWGYE